MYPQFGKFDHYHIVKVYRALRDNGIDVCLKITRCLIGKREYSHLVIRLNGKYLIESQSYSSAFYLRRIVRKEYGYAIQIEKECR